MRVTLSAAARSDLALIGDYIAADNPERAVSFTAELLERCAGLCDLPRAFPLVPRYEALGVRRRNHGRYAIFYRINGSMIEVLHILHSAQDFAQILFPES